MLAKIFSSHGYLLVFMFSVVVFLVLTILSWTLKKAFMANNELDMFDSSATDDELDKDKKD